MKKNTFLGFLPKDTVVDCSIRKHRFWPSPSSTSSQSWEKKNETQEDTAWLVILEKEVSNNSWEPLKFLLRDKKTVGANTVESSDSLKYV